MTVLKIMEFSENDRCYLANRSFIGLTIEDIAEAAGVVSSEDENLVDCGAETAEIDEKWNEADD